MVTYHHARNLHTQRGPRAALPVMFADSPPRSLLDVGCGTGTWLQVALQFGVEDVCGVDGVTIPDEQLLFPPRRFRVQDLTQPWDLGRRFDALLCLEVAEHLDERHAQNLIQTLTCHADLVYFSAACPGQPGEHHVNCQWPEYWQRLFNDAGYVCSDAVRWLLWDDDAIEPWYRQNIFVARREPAAGQEPRIKAAIHPALLPYLEVAYRQRSIETGGMSMKWYASLPMKAVVHKLSRKLNGRDSDSAPLGPRT